MHQLPPHSAAVTCKAQGAHPKHFLIAKRPQLRLARAASLGGDSTEASLATTLNKGRKNLTSFRVV